MGRLGAEPDIVGRLGSGMRVSASPDIPCHHGLVRIARPLCDS